MSVIFKEHGWLAATILILIQFLWSLYKERSNEDRKLLKQIQKDVNMSFALLRIMSGEKYPEIVKRVIDEKVLRE